MIKREFKSTYDYARDYVSQGYSVIPLEETSEKPAIQWNGIPEKEGQRYGTA